MISEIIEEFNYTPNQQNRNFKKKVNKTIALVIADITDSFYSTLCKGITDASYSQNCHVLIANSDNNIKREQEYIDSFLSKVDGLLIGTTGNNDAYLTSLKGKIPIVLIDRRTEPLFYDLVSSNNYDAITELLEYLLAMGYESFGFFTEELQRGMARTIRGQAFKDFAESNNLSDSSSIHTINIYDEKIMMKELMPFVEINKNKKTVAIGANGRTLLQLISCLNAMDIKIPNQVGICGYDDFEWAPLVQSGITTINQPTYDIGYKAVEMLVARIENRDAAPPSIVELRSKIARRGSV